MGLKEAHGNYKVRVVWLGHNNNRNHEVECLVPLPGWSDKEGEVYIEKLQMYL